MNHRRTRARGLLIIGMAVCASACDPDLLGRDAADRSGVPAVYTVGGTVAGLASGASLKLLDRMADPVTVSSNGRFIFPTSLAAGASYSVSVSAQPSGQMCTVAGGSGQIDAANVANAVVTCSDQSYTLGGSVLGLDGYGLVLTNGTDTVTVSAGATSFAFPTPVAYTSAYAVSVQTQPAGLACAVAQGAGSMPANDVTSVAVSCTGKPFVLGGSIQGLGNNTGLVLANGSDTLAVSANASAFTMPAAIDFGSPYALTVQSAPGGITCGVTRGSGSMPASNVTDVLVTCADRAYGLGGLVTGLTANGLVLANGADTLSVPANSTQFTMPMPVAYTSAYTVVVQTQPAGLRCTVSNGAGTMGTAPVNNLSVSCGATYTIGGTITGLGASSGLVIASGSETLTILPNATIFTLPQSQASGSTYDVVVQTTPMLALCTVSNGTGVVAGSDITNITLSCGPGTESVLYSFQGPPGDGSHTNDSHSMLQGADGNFYGVTYSGGSHDRGTVFKITPAGVETVLWSFGGGSDGQYPAGGMILGSDGNFYGTTGSGGANNMGAVYKISPAGAETVIYSFAGGADGQNPYGNLIEAADGNFYGMTDFGGSNHVGTVFKVTPQGTESVLWTFGNGADGQSPYGGLAIGRDGNLYGSTGAGGINNAGAFFKLTPQGAETVLYSFHNSGTDGAYPYGSILLGTDGNFYGSTNGGGAYNQGTVYKMTPTGAETVLWSFGAGTDGQQPYGSLIQGTDGNFYGLTGYGGSNGSGAIFQVTPAGAETVLWSFGSGNDGSNPWGTLVEGSNGFLYGITDVGGTGGFGVVFQFD